MYLFLNFIYTYKNYFKCKFLDQKKKIWGISIRPKKSDEDNEQKAEKKIMKWCYFCGRSVGVKLMPCSRCKKVFYCSNNCKQRGWNELHKNECELPESGINHFILNLIKFYTFWF